MEEPGESAGASSSAPNPSLSASARTTAPSHAPVIVTYGPIVLQARSRSPSPAPSVDPKKDLWLTTVDGRFGSPSIPIRVGRFPNVETFFVRRVPV
jgi:hypothetical protein